MLSWSNSYRIFSTVSKMLLATASIMTLIAQFSSLIQHSPRYECSNQKLAIYFLVPCLCLVSLYSFSLLIKTVTQPQWQLTFTARVKTRWLPFSSLFLILSIYLASNIISDLKQATHCFATTTEIATLVLSLICFIYFQLLFYWVLQNCYTQDSFSSSWRKFLFSALIVVIYESVYGAVVLMATLSNPKYSSWDDYLRTSIPLVSLFILAWVAFLHNPFSVSACLYILVYYPISMTHSVFWLVFSFVSGDTPAHMEWFFFAGLSYFGTSILSYVVFVRAICCASREFVSGQQARHSHASQLQRVSLQGNDFTFDKNDDVLQTQGEINQSLILNRMQEQCLICWEDFHEAKSLLIVKECKHIFHEVCLKKWIDNAKTCPACRIDIDDGSPAMDYD